MQAPDQHLDILESAWASLGWFPVLVGMCVGITGYHLVLRVDAYWRARNWDCLDFIFSHAGYPPSVWSTAPDRPAPSDGRVQPVFRARMTEFSHMKHPVHRPPYSPRNPFQHLPPELMSQVVHRMDATTAALFAKVCKTAASCSLQSLQALDLCGLGDAVSNSDLTTLLAKCPNLTMLSLRGCWRVQDDGLIAVPQLCPKLTSLDISWCGQCSNEALEVVAKQMPQLRQLCVYTCGRINERGILWVTRHCLKLQCLIIEGSQRITDETVSFFCKEARRTLSASLRDVALLRCCSVTDAAFPIIASSLPEIESFTITQNSFITDEGLLQLVLRPSNPLQHLDVSECPRITGKGLIAVAARCPHLRRLVVHQCAGVTEEEKQELARLISRVVGVVGESEAEPEMPDQDTAHSEWLARQLIPQWPVNGPFG